MSPSQWVFRSLSSSVVCGREWCVISGVNHSGSGVIRAWECSWLALAGGCCDPEYNGVRCNSSQVSAAAHCCDAGWRDILPQFLGLSVVLQYLCCLESVAHLF